MALGKAVVASDIGGPREQIEDGISGMLVAPGDSAALARAICDLLARPGEACLVGSARRRPAFVRGSRRRGSIGACPGRTATSSGRGRREHDRQAARASRLDRGPLLGSPRHALRRSVMMHPSLYLPLARWKRAESVLDARTELVLDGLERSANTFATVAFQLAQNDHVRVAHHMHAVAPLMEAAARGRADAWSRFARPRPRSSRR